MKKIIFLVSGNGGNLKFLNAYLQAASDNRFCISAVIADRECGALNYAKADCSKSFLIKYDSSNLSELRNLLFDLNPDFIVTNIHKILDKEIVSAFHGKLINIHYSLLPAFKGGIGVKPIQDALSLGSKIIGTTIHYVNEELDSGQIISQSSIFVEDGFDFDNVVSLIFRSGCLNLLNSFFILFNIEDVKRERQIEYFNMLGKVYFFAPSLKYRTDFLTVDFWNSLVSH